jgi:NAD(P)H-hydrate epimerase
MAEQHALILDREHSRRVDQIAMRVFGMSGLVLMENAGRGCAEHLLSAGINGQVVVCCGPGNNGGDGLVIARHLAIAGVRVNVLVAAKPEQLSPDAAANFSIIAKTAAAPICLPGANGEEIARRIAPGKGSQVAWVVDALLGTGTQGRVRPPLDRWIRAINSVGLPVLAVDIPSGLDCDTGQAEGECVRATETCTLVAKKPCFLREPGKSFAGKVSVIGIGVPQEIIRFVESQGTGGELVDFAIEQGKNGAET